MYEYRAKIERCVDGDSVWASVDLGFGIAIRESFRLLGIDTPERGQPGFTEATEHLEMLLEAAICSDGYVTCITHKREKYGRILIEFLDHNGQSINRQMVEAGHAVEYMK